MKLLINEIAIQVQVLSRDLKLWIKEYRVYLNSADALIGALKSWLTFDSRDQAKLAPYWDLFFTQIEKASVHIFPLLESTIMTKCIEPLEVNS